MTQSKMHSQTISEDQTSFILTQAKSSFHVDSSTAKSILTALLLALLHDIRRAEQERICYGTLGWRNKYNIHLASKVSQKKIYRKFGVIEQLVLERFVEQRSSPTTWGKQKLQYRLRLVPFLDLIDSDQLQLLVQLGTEHCSDKRM